MSLAPIHISVSQVIIVLAGFPALYWLNGLTPWSKGLFVDFLRSHRRRFYLSIEVLHLLTTLWAMLLLYQSGVSLPSLGLNPMRTAIGIAIFLIFGGLIATIGSHPPLEAGKEGELTTEPVYKRISFLLIPATRTERCEFVLVSLIAGFCEEFLYRGFGILALKGLGMSNGWAVLLCACSFTLIHARAAVSPMGIFWMLKGLFYGWLYLWTDSLLLVMALHGFWDLGLLLRPRRKQSEPTEKSPSCAT
jgi:membrane protease YdiL (CAAX protease family)